MVNLQKAICIGTFLLLTQLHAFSQNVGIGTATPEFKLDVDGGIMARGLLSVSQLLQTSGAGTRCFWYPRKSAFRAGTITGDHFDEAGIGDYSTAFGFNCRASKRGSFAVGDQCYANGSYSIAMGNLSDVPGNYSIGMGFNSYVSGNNALGLGWSVNATASYSMAIGRNVNSTHNGALVLGDSGPEQLNSATTNSFRARFDNGYRFYTSENLTTNALLAGGDNSWSITSDHRLKENILETNGEDFLKRISTLHLTSWNYKLQDPAKHRHYGPMAQDFFAAFGNDGLGTIGSDTTINQADFQGVNLIAIQALIKRTEDLDNENRTLKQKFDDISGELESMKEMIRKLQAGK